MYEKTTEENLYERLLILSDMFKLVVSYVNRNVGGVDKHKFRVRCNMKIIPSAEIVNVKLYDNYRDALMAGVDWCFNYLESKGKENGISYNT